VTKTLAITEKQWMAQVVELAGILGWQTYHAFLSIHSPRGWPDLALCRPPRLVLAELKTDAKAAKVTAAQQMWLDLLGACDGVEAYVWRPSDLEAVTAVLR
jgi:hypothetical protein